MWSERKRQSVYFKTVKIFRGFFSHQEMASNCCFDEVHMHEPQAVLSFG